MSLTKQTLARVAKAGTGELDNRNRDSRKIGVQKPFKVKMAEFWAKRGGEPNHDHRWKKRATN